MFIDEIKDGHFGKKDSLVDIGKGKNISNDAKNPRVMQSNLY